tara:strand:+ start:860 stop:1030 length:171 start_codon:yes stop_codon:yes gene_type:complete
MEKSNWKEVKVLIEESEKLRELGKLADKDQAYFDRFENDRLVYKVKKRNTRKKTSK